MVAYGGRIAEEMFLGDLSTGAKADIDQATTIARRMVCEWGMSDKLGPIKYQEDEETIFLGREITRTQNHSPETAVLIDQEVRKLVDGCYAEAKGVLASRKDDVELIARALMEYEVITGEELTVLLKEHKLPADRKPLKQVGPLKPRQAEGAPAAKPGAEALPDGRSMTSPSPA